MMSHIGDKRKQTLKNMLGIVYQQQNKMSKTSLDQFLKELKPMILQ